MDKNLYPAIYVFMWLILKYKPMKIFSTIAAIFLFLSLNAQTYNGKAIFYGDKYQGRTTASGEIFKQSELTAAHATLPFNTIVKVSNTQNNKSVVVRINDRMPKGKGRIIELSKAAARKLDILELGEAKIKVEIIGDASLMYNGKQFNPSDKGFLFEMKIPTVSVAGYGLQVASLFDMKNVYQTINQLSVDWGNNVLVYVDTKGSTPKYKIIIGPFDTRADAEAYKKNMKVIYGASTKLTGFIVDFEKLK